MKLLDSTIDEDQTITFIFDGGIELVAYDLGFGDKYWYLNGKFHREDGPAIELASCDKYWYLNGKTHREEGPAIEYANGDKHWYLNDKLHREDGPAVESANGDKRWYLNGIELTQKQFNETIAIRGGKT